MGKVLKKTNETERRNFLLRAGRFVAIHAPSIRHRKAIKLLQKKKRKKLHTAAGSKNLSRQDLLAPCAALRGVEAINTPKG